MHTEGDVIRHDRNRWALQGEVVSLNGRVEEQKAIEQRVQAVTKQIEEQEVKR